MSVKTGFITADEPCILAERIPEELALTRAKTNRWESLSSGDCVGSPIEIICNSNGTGRGSAVTWTNSTHSGDYWRMNFELMDANRVVLANTVNVDPRGVFDEVVYEPPFTNRIIRWQFNSPKMDDTGPNGVHAPRYSWAFEFTFEAATFDRISVVRIVYKA